MRSLPPSSSANRSIFSLGTPDRMERSNSTPTPRSPLTVDEEYGRAFKSKSFLDLWSNAHRHLRNTFKRSSSTSNKSIITSSFDKEGSSCQDHADAVEEQQQSCSYTVLDDFVLETSPEELLVRGSRCRRRVDSLLIEYFDVTQEACEACSDLLAAIGAARRHHLTLRRLLWRMMREKENSAAGDALAEHVRLANPLSPSGSLSAFHDVHRRCGPLAARLAAAQRRLRRLARAARVVRGMAAAALVAASAAGIVAAAVFAAHAVVVGVSAAAVVGATSPATAVRWAAEKVRSERHYARAGATVDAAARGAYIAGRDMDTLSRMVRRAHDELEHGRHMARIAVLSGHDVELLLLQEVAREEAECEAGLREQLEEMEEHVCLCLITINRSRRMVAHHNTRRGLPPSP